MSENNQPTHPQYTGNELALFAHAKNWKSYWSSKISPLLGDSVLEVGAGIGTNLVHLYTPQRRWTSLEPDTEQFEKIKVMIDKQFSATDSIQAIQGTITDVPRGSLFDSILYIDVLEHIENDRDELKQAINLCNIGGRLIVVAPAHNFLFSPFDTTVGHFRRYNKKELFSLTPQNASIREHFYLDSAGCIASYCNSRLFRSTLPTINQILFWDKVLVPCSKLLDRIAGYSLGKTIVVVWQRRC